jgi:hypothetical protein
MSHPEEIFTDIPLTFAVRVFLDGLIEVRRDLLIDPLLATLWSCDPDRCRPLLGPNLCCKVETRCPELRGERCGIQDRKPFSCALFPLDLVRAGGLRVVTTAKNRDFFSTGWSRYDRDMLRCFEGIQRGAEPMLRVQQPVLLRIFTASEVALMERTLLSVERSSKSRRG